MNESSPTPLRAGKRPRSLRVLPQGRPLRARKQKRPLRARKQKRPPLARKQRRPLRARKERRPLRALWRLLRWPLLVLAVLIVFIEEFGWRPLAAWAGQFARWPPIARVEALIVRAPPRLALALFVVPAVLLFPIKLLAIGLMHAGRPWLGIGVLLAAKLLGTAFVGRLFVLLEPQLMQFERFRRLIDWWRETRERVKEAVFQTAAWQESKALLLRGRNGWRRMLGR